MSKKLFLLTFFVTILTVTFADVIKAADPNLIGSGQSIAQAHQD